MRVNLLSLLFLISTVAAEMPVVVSVSDGPILLHANLEQQWGGHTFSYLLEGPQALYWTASQYNADGKTWASLIGQFPKGAPSLARTVTRIPIPGEKIKYITQPLILRTADGYLHLFNGVSFDTGDPGYAPGEIRYLRSSAPDDATSFVDRSELIPKELPFNEFHLRMNVGLSRDGQRAALLVLAISKDGSVPFNTPVLFLADKVGPDLVFRKPVQYAEPMGLFYPQVAYTDDGIVVIGQVWDNKDRSTARLLHLSADATLLHRVEFPAESDGNYWCCDLRPESAANWATLNAYYCKYPKGGQDCRHEFWTYDVQARSLILRKSIVVPEGQVNSGKCIPLAPNRALFLHNPQMGTFEVYDGDLFHGGDFTMSALPATNPLSQGYAGSACTFVPNPLQGSLPSPSGIWFATDTLVEKLRPEDRLRANLLLYRLNY